MINPDRLTVKSTEALNEALSLARRAGNPLVYDLHLLFALLNQDDGIVVPVLQKIGVSLPSLREAVERELARSMTWFISRESDGCAPVCLG